MANSRLGPVDLSALPPPDALDPVDWLTSVAQMKTDLLERYPDAADVIDDQLEPLVYLIQNYAARETQLRLEWNDKVRAVLLPTSMDADLDNVAALYNVTRLVDTPGSEDGSTAPVMESNERFRQRTQLAPEAFATTGAREAYLFHTLTAHPKISSAQVYNYVDTGDAPGTVRVVIYTDDPSYEQEALNAVRQRLNREDIRPLTDSVQAQLATRLVSNVKGTLYIRSGPSSSLVADVARAQLSTYLLSVKKIGRLRSLSGIYAALRAPGVETVLLETPTVDASPGKYAVFEPGSIELETVIVHD